MFTEIEAKLKVDSLGEIERKLPELGAEFQAEQLQIDYFFDDVNSTLAKTDRCLRLRKQMVGKNESFLLTYKGAREKSNFKRRQEIEFEIKDADSVRKLLLVLGYEQSLVVEKKRRFWKLGDCEVALDRLPLLGDFVEIEGPNEEKIATMQKSLGLIDLPHIIESYASLVTKKQIVNSK
jgi:adenylate cyclase class 2